MGWFLCVGHDREEIHPVSDGPEDFVTRLILQLQLRAQIFRILFLLSLSEDNRTVERFQYLETVI